MTAPKRILIADDHAVFREGLKHIIATSPDMKVIGEADNGREALNLLQHNRYDLVILDITMPDRNGLEILKEIKEATPLLPVLIMSMHPEDLYALLAVRAGASGYLTKDCPRDEFLDVVHKILDGKRHISMALTEMLLKGEFKEELSTRHNELSNREFQVMCLIASGKPLNRIASDLSLSVKTVYSHRSHILRKMSMSNNADLTRYVITHQLI